MDDKLIKRVSVERDAFDKYEAPTGIWDEIEKSLDQKSSHKASYREWLRVVASILLLGIISVFWLNINMEDEEDLIRAIYKNSPELAEAELYYKVKIQNKLNVLTTKMPDNNAYIYDMAMLDSAYVALRKDLKDQADNEEVVKAMIENYKLKLMMLERILNTIEDNTNENQDENISL